MQTSNNFELNENIESNKTKHSSKKKKESKKNPNTAESLYTFFAELHPDIQKGMDSLGEFYAGIAEKIKQPA